MGIVLDGLAFLLSNIGKILAIVGVVSVGDWAIKKYDSGTSSSTGGSSGTSASKPTLLGTANLWAYALLGVGLFSVIREYLKAKDDGAV